MISKVDLCRLLAARGEGWAGPGHEQSNWFLSSCPSIPLGVATRVQSKASGIKLCESLSHFRKLVTVLRPILYILSVVVVSCEWIIPMQGKEQVFLPLSHLGTCVGGSESAWLGAGTGILLPGCFCLRNCQVFGDTDKTIKALLPITWMLLKLLCPRQNQDTGEPISVPKEPDKIKPQLWPLCASLSDIALNSI